MSPDFHSPHKLKYAPLSKAIDLTDFDCGDADLNDFIKNDALGYHEKGLANTTCVFFDTRLIGPGNKPRKIPAIKVARMAFAKDMQRLGLGKLVMEIIKGFAIDINQKGLGVRFITVDAYPDKVDFYKSRGVVLNAVKSGTSPTVSMRCDLFK
jgi:GNAT superfamily N-acetyltransferase